MTDLTRTFIPVADDTINAANFLETTAHGSRDAARCAREDACQLAAMLSRFVTVSPALWAAMKDDMRRLSADAGRRHGVALPGDLVRAGYSAEIIAAFARSNVVQAVAIEEAAA